MITKRIELDKGVAKARKTNQSDHRELVAMQN